MQIPAPTFPLFPTLPAELRLQVWRDALPDHIQPALFLWKCGCWAIGLLTEYEFEYEPDNDEVNLILEFRYNVLNPIRFDNPLLSTNNEARQITLIWAAKNGFQLQQANNADYTIARRAFQPDNDTIFIPPYLWQLFLYEAVYRAYEPDLIDRNYSNCSEIYQLAIPGILFYKNTPIGLEDIFESCPY